MSNNDKGQLDLSDLVAALCTAATALSAEDRAGLVNVLKNLAGQHSDVLETLPPKVWKRADVKFNDYPSEIGSMSSTTCHVVYAFLIPMLVSLLQLKYQNKSVSPFETQPIEMGTFFTTFSLYCSTLVAENVAQTYHNKYSKILGFVSTVFGALSSLSLISLFLPKSIIVVILAICSVLSLMVALHFLMRFCQWIYQKSVNAVLQLINMFRTLMGRTLMEQNYLV